MNINIRTIQPSDNAALASIIRNTFEEFDAPRVGTVYSDPSTDKLYENFEQQGAKGWTAEINGKIVGCCGLYPTPGLDHRRNRKVLFTSKCPRQWYWQTFTEEKYRICPTSRLQKIIHRKLSGI